MADTLNNQNPADPKGQPQTVGRIAAQILRKNVLNLAKKVADGKTLSAAEIAMVKEGLEETEGTVPGAAPVWVKTQVDLATALGVARETVKRWAKDATSPEARSDGRYNVSEWKEWARKNGKRLGEEAELPSETALRVQNLILQNQRLTVQNKILSRDYWDATEIEKVGARLGAAIRKVVASLHLIAPSIVGLTVPEAENLLKEKEDEIIEQLHTMASGFSEIRSGDAGEHNDENE